MQFIAPESWAPGAYERARKMWTDGALPSRIVVECRITIDQLYKIRRRHGWPERQRVGLERDRSALDLVQMRADWVAGVSKHSMSVRYHINKKTVTAIAEREGWPERDDMRPALPAGHPDTWGLICSGTLLQGAAFPR